MHCGVLALQGDWAAHAARMRSLGVETRLVRTADDLAEVDCLVLPGGESTAMLKLMEAEGLAARIKDRIAAGVPVLATCAGVILLAARTTPAQASLGLLDVDVERNAYGRQIHSRVAAVELDSELGQPAAFDGVFIRAPRIVRTGPEVSILGRLEGDAVLVRQGGIIAATFHPELAEDDRVHRLLLNEEERHG